MHFNRCATVISLSRSMLCCALLLACCMVHSQMQSDSQNNSANIPLLSALPNTATSPTEEPANAGKIVLVRGKVFALRTGTTERALRRRAKVFSGETIITRDNSTAQLRMIDGAIFSLQENTEFVIKTYQLAERDQSDKAVTKLLQGGLRTITGSIGHTNKDDYELQTSVATIGIRGTTFQVVYETPITLVAAAWQGGINMASESGDIELGVGAAFNFARLETGEKPQGLLEPPASLLADNSTQVNDPNQDGNNDDDDDTDDADQDDDTEPSSDDDTVDDDPADSSPADDDADAQDDNTDTQDDADNTDSDNTDTQDQNSNSGDPTADDPDDQSVDNPVADADQQEPTSNDDVTDPADTDPATTDPATTEPSNTDTADADATSPATDDTTIIATTDTDTADTGTVDQVTVDSVDDVSLDSTQDTNTELTLDGGGDLLVASDPIVDPVSDTTVTVDPILDTPINTDPTVNPADTGTGIVDTSAIDARLTNTEVASLDRIGLIVGSQPCLPTCAPKFLGGLSGDATNGDQIVLNNGVGLGDPTFGDFPSPEIVRGDSSLAIALTTNLVGGSAVSWGAWTADSINPILIQDSLTDPNSVSQITQVALFASVVPTDPLVLTASFRYGTDSFPLYTGGSLIDSLIESPSTIVGLDEVGFDIDFNTGLISNGILDFALANGEFVITDFDGQVFGAKLDLSFINIGREDGNRNTLASFTPGIQDVIGGVVTGANGEGALLGFGFIDQFSGDPIAGFTLLGQAPPGVTNPNTQDPRLSNTDVSSLDRIGLMLGSLPCTPICEPNFGGGLASDAALGDPIIIDNGVPLSDPNFDGFPATNIIRGDASLASALTTNVVGGSAVSWGLWSATTVAPILMQDSLSDPRSFSTLTETLLFASIVPTDPTVLTGTFRYGVDPLPFYSGGTLIDSLIESPAAILGLDGVGFDINFNTGLISNGILNFALVSGEFVKTDFNGQLFGANLDLSFTDIARADTSRNILATFTPGIQDVIGGVVTGANGEGALLGFSFIDQFSGDPIAGFTLLGQGLFGVANPNSQDPRLSNTQVASLDRLGLVLGSQPCLPLCEPNFLGGLASDAASGDAIIVDNGVPLSDPNFGSFPGNNIIRGDSNLASALTTNIIGGSEVSWGLWSATTATPILVQDSPVDPRSVSPLTETLLFASIIPSDPLVLTGSFRYGTDSFPLYAGGSLIDSLVESPSAIIGLDEVGFDIDFNTGLISNGILDFTLATGDFVITNFDGQVFGANLDLNFTSLGREDTNRNPVASYTPGIQDFIGGVVTGANGEGALLGFSFIDQFSGDPIAGFTLLGQGPTGVANPNTQDPRLSNTEVTSLDRFGIVLGSLPCTPICESNFGGGLASDASLGDPIILENGVPLSDPNFEGFPATNIVRGDASLASALTANIVGGSEVSWGLWSANATTPIVVQDSFADPRSFSTLTETLLFASIIPSDPLVLTGTFRYGTEPFPFYASGTLIDSLIESPSAIVGLDQVGFDVDFNTGAISNGILDFALASGDFVITDFDGLVFGPKLELNFINIEREDAGGNVLATFTPGIQDVIGGVVTGANGEGALIGFSFIDQFSGDPIAGFALLGQGPLGVVDPSIQDPRLSNAEVASLDRIGLVIGAEPCLPTCLPKFGGGLSSDALNGDPIIIDSQVPLGDPSFGSFPSSNIIRGDANLAGLLTTNVVGGVPVTWGVWSADPTNPILVQDSLIDPTSLSSFTEKILFASVLPTDPTVLTGYFRYGPDPAATSGGGSLIDFVIESPSAIVGIDEVGFDIDFNTGSISNGILDFALANGEFIITDFDGTLFGARLDLNFTAIERDDVNQIPIATFVPGSQDTIGGVVTGANGEGALLGFSFIDQFSGDPVAGFALLGQGAPTIDLRLSDPEINSLDRIGLLLAPLEPCPPPSTQCGPKQGGGRGSDASGGFPILTDNATGPGMPGFNDVPPVNIFRPGASNVYVEAPVPEVSWGIWADTASASSATRSSSAYSQTDPLDPSVTNPLNDAILFASVIPADPSLLVGSFTYSNVLADFVWVDSGGTLFRAGGIASQFDVDFNTGTVTNGLLDISTPGIIASFDGNVVVDAGAAFLNLNLIDINGGMPLLQDSIGGIFTGPSGDVAAMGFSFIDPTSGSAAVGYYLLGR